jgi:hypothetical protein
LPSGTGQLAAVVKYQGACRVNLYELSEQLSATSMSQAIQVTSWAIPTIQVVHILSLALLFASALVFTLRLFGAGISTEPLHQLGARFLRVIWFSLLALLFSGALLILAEPGRTITNPVFYAKMAMLALAVIITLWLAAVARRQLVRPGSIHRGAAVVAMGLWVGIMFAGRLIAYVEAG